MAGVAKEHKLTIFLYPTAADLRNRSKWLEVMAPILELCKTTQAKCLDIAQEPAWTEKAYGSDGIHPTLEGNKILASILAKTVD